MLRPSGDQPAALVALRIVSRRGVPPGQSMTYSRPSALNASRRPSGEGTASRIWRASKVSAASTV
jgi:hypothetical protein